MKSKSLATLGLLALLAATSAFGQQKLTADIPFEFRIGAKVMPAGRYAVNRSFNGMQSQLQLRGDKGQARAMTSNVGGYNNPPAKGRLVFHKYGDTYFLSRVWTSGSGVGSALPESKSEREIARNAPPETSEIPLDVKR